MPTPSFLERIAAWPWAEGVTVLFGFAWGAMLGSFINVVVHRLPRGESVVAARSRCPQCGSAIRPRDNIPVLGWLWLRGRCRDCAAPIAASYPLVEAACGGIVMLLAATELVGGGRWLPAFAAEPPQGIDRLLRGDWTLLLVLFVHSAAVLTVVAWSLLDGEGHRLPPAWLGATLVVAVTAVAAVPQAAPLDIWSGSAAWPPTAGRLAAALVGVLAGWLAGRAGRGQAVRWGLPLVGSVLGWQGVTVVAVASAVAGSLTRSRAAGRGGWIAAATTFWLAFFGPLTRGIMSLLVAELAP